MKKRFDNCPLCDCPIIMVKQDKRNYVVYCSECHASVETKDYESVEDAWNEGHLYTIKEDI